MCETSSLPEPAVRGRRLQAEDGVGPAQAVPSPDGFAGSVVLQLQRRTRPSTHRAGTSVAGRFWAKAVQKKVLGKGSPEELAVCHTAAALSGQPGSSGKGSSDGTLQPPCWELAWNSAVRIVPCSRRKGTKRLKTVKLRERGCSSCSSVTILFGAGSLQRRVVTEGLALCSACTQPGLV